MSDEIPLFPLRTVLFPGGVLPLRIFEVRYIDMVRHCMRAASGFGVVLIESGAEAGEVNEIHNVGTFAEIVDFSQLEDGLLGITAAGRRRFRVTAARRQPDGLNIADVEWLTAPSEHPLPDEYELFGQLLRQALPQLGALYDHLEPRYEEAGWVADRLAEILPLPLEEKQLCLEIDDPIRRLEHLRPMIRIEVKDADAAE